MGVCTVFRTGFALALLTDKTGAAARLRCSESFTIAIFFDGSQKKLVPLSSALGLLLADLACVPIEQCAGNGASMQFLLQSQTLHYSELPWHRCLRLHSSPIERAPWSACSFLLPGAAAFMAPAQAPQTLTRHHLFGGKKEGGGGGALGNVAGVMDQFKKAQEIAKKSQELQTELAAAEFEGASADGSVTFKMNGQQQPVSAAAPASTARAPRTCRRPSPEAMADAQAKSLAAMNEKMQALYASVGLGGAGM